MWGRRALLTMVHFARWLLLVPRDRVGSVLAKG